jgi:hypothetical protein
MFARHYQTPSRIMLPLLIVVAYFLLVATFNQPKVSAECEPRDCIEYTE